MIDYTIFYKCELPISGPWPAGSEWDILLTAYTDAERVADFIRTSAGC